MESKLDSSVQYVPRVGPRMAALLKKLGIETVYDLLTYVPFRYNDYSLVSPIARLQPGETVTLMGTLEYIRTFVTKTGKRLVMGSLRDESGAIDLVWFNQVYLVNVLHAGDRLSVSGKVDWFGKKVVLSSPDYEVIGEQASLHTGRLVPVYSETEGLSSKWLRGRIAYVLEQCLPEVSEQLPEEVLREQKLMGLREAISTVHFPKSQEAAKDARERLAFDELFTLILRANLQKHTWKTTLTATPFPIEPKELSQFIGRLPFVLTDDQLKAVNELLADVRQSIPMNRLLEGDVGAGKTVVAAVGMYAAALQQSSSVLLAPTQILAQQHHQTLRALLGPHGIQVKLVIGGTTKKNTELRIVNTDKSPSKKNQHSAFSIHNSIPSVYVGTHALLTKRDQLPDFGLIVIDEQQRFGVTQRALLRTHAKGRLVPHQLTMTATPIPRTIVQTVFGNLDLSILRTMPKGRKIVKTWVVRPEKREAAYGWIAKELTTTHSQAFVICPLIDESETAKAVKAATTEYERLKEIFATLWVGLLHGRMRAEQKTDILERMRNHSIDILVATPVVEVGIDIPEATIMVVEAAERFGLSQLHQLRGRVGRREKPSYCLLFTEMETPEVLARLKSLETVHNGPELAELDLKLRGPGELFGTRQHGLPGFALATLTDTALVARAKQSVTNLMVLDPELSRFPHLR